MSSVIWTELAGARPDTSAYRSAHHSRTRAQVGGINEKVTKQFQAHCHDLVYEATQVQYAAEQKARPAGGWGDGQGEGVPGRREREDQPHGNHHHA